MIQSVHPKSVLKFETGRIRVGHTSVTYHVDVYARHIDSTREERVFQTDITFVRTTPDGVKMPIE